MRLARKRDPNADGPRFAALAVVWITIVVIAIGLYLSAGWHRHSAVMQREATVLAKSLETLIYPEHVSILEGTSADVERRRYELVKSSLVRLATAKNDIEYAYLVTARDGKVIYLADSLSASDPASALPGDPYPEATEAFRTALEEGKNAFIPEMRDARGRWACALVPVHDIVTGEPVALFGIDFDARLWNERLIMRMRPDFVVSLSLVFLSFALAGIYIAHERLKIKNEETAANESLLQSVFDQAPIGIAISSRTHVVNRDYAGGSRTNRAFAKIIGRSADELASLEWAKISMPDKSVKDQFDCFMAGETAEFVGEKDCILPNGRYARLNLKLSRLVGASFEGAFLALVEDITQRHTVEQALRESERSKAVLLSHLPGMAYRCRYDRDWTMDFVSEACAEVTGYRPDELIENRVLSYNDVIAPEYRETLWNEWNRAAERDANFRYEYEIVSKSGERRWVLEIGQAVRDASGEIVALEGLVIDITDRIRREREIAYLSEHDHLTGLYDRRHILEAAARLDARGVLPVAVAVCDISSVRMVNFAFGNDEGDRLITDVGRIILSCGREDDMIGRTGGDEFTLLLPGVTLEEAGKVSRRIERAVEEYNRTENRHPYEVSLSIGFDAKESADVRIEQVIKAACESLMHAKLLNLKSSHSALLTSIMAALYARNQETEEHGQRLARYARMTSEALGLPSKVLDEIRLLSMLHDIGKIGIDDRVLMKPAALTSEEREEMKKHCEIGHRIALTSPELSHIADYILYHHEKWDGTGYPAGLAGEAIPLPSRILAVCDAYDAMTEDRVYRRAMSKKDALEEIARCSGTQFDPMIARLFIARMEAQGEAGA